MNTVRLLPTLSAALCLAISGLSSVGCVTTAMGQGPAEQDLVNDGSVEEQLELFRAYEVTYDSHTFRRPGADPAAVGAEIHRGVDSVSAAAWSDDAFNYLSSSQRAAEVMEDPAVAFDAFAHSGMGETVLLGVGLGGGMATGAIAWFINTTVRDGVSDVETSDLISVTATGLGLGGFLGLIVAGAYTYIVPAVSAPFAVPLYRKAARAFNEDLEDRVLDNAPAGDPPPTDADVEGNTGADGEAEAPAAETVEPAQPEAGAETAPPAPGAPSSTTPAPIEPREG